MIKDNLSDDFVQSEINYFRTDNRLEKPFKMPYKRHKSGEYKIDNITGKMILL